MRHASPRADRPTRLAGLGLAALICGASQNALADGRGTSILPGGTHEIDFSQYIGRMEFTNGPVDLGQGVTWSATSEGVIGDMFFGLRTNGMWNTQRAGFAALDIEQSAMLFTFDRPYQWVSAFVNYAPFSQDDPIPTLIVFDEHAQVIGSISMDVRTPNGVNDGATLALEMAAPRIYSVRYSARFGVLDDFMFGEFERPGFIPAPGAWTLLAAPFLFAGRARRRSGQRHADT